MGEHTETDNRFEQLWQRAVSCAVEPMPDQDDGDVELSADLLIDWLRQIAENCRTNGLVDETAYTELARCNETYARVLGSIDPGRLRPHLQALSGQDEE
ncbi:MAG: hypothetical protein ACFB6S_16395 [Geminicoccaceae bacterium]